MRLIKYTKKKMQYVVLCTLFLVPSSLFSQTTILMLGDSLTQGFGLSQHDGLVPQLSAWMSRNTDETIYIINGGVSGDTSAGGLSRLEWYLADDIDIMIVALGANDFLRGIDPGELRKNLDQILKIGFARGLKLMLVGFAAQNNFGQLYKTEFNQIFPTLAKKYETKLVANLMHPILERLQAGERPRLYLQSDMLHPNTKGVALIVEHLGSELIQMIQE